MDKASQLLLWGIVAHLTADWLLQNDWMANYKDNLKHRAAWTHGLIQTIAMLLVFPVPVAIAIGAVHMLIDLREVLRWWRAFFRQTRQGEVALHVAIWGDQVLHILIIAIAARLTTGA